MLVNFSELHSSKHNGKLVTVRCIVSGKSVSPYVVPKKIEVKCSKNDCDNNCPALKKNFFIIEANDDILKFIDVSDSVFHKVIKGILKISCKKFLYDIKSVQNIERIFISAPTGKERIKNTSSYACYYMGYGIDINTTYELEGYPTNDPKSQMVTVVFTDAEKIKSDIDSFSITKEIKDQLNDFVISKPSSDRIFSHLTKIYTYYSRNITKIYDREDLHMCVDLFFKSPIAFKFDNERVHKGWIDAVIIGDTRCGKGYVAEKMMKFFSIGEVISGDNVSFSGLIGGLQQYDGHWIITWGKIPLNDKGAIIIDEANEIKEWSRLSRVRSEGIAEIVKIHAQITNARTRLLFLMNPINKTISNYSYGIQALTDVIKAPEDIARFDYALVVSHGEVSIGEINKTRDEVVPVHDQVAEQNLILWIWSRKQADIVFSPEAVKRTYQLSIKMAKEYSFTIPLIQGENVRIKLAKMAICFAGRVYSNKHGKILFVDEVHVECAYIFFKNIYKKETSGYYAMSLMQKAFDMDASPANLSSIEKYFNTFHNSKIRLLKQLLSNNVITSEELIEQIPVNRDVAHELISRLLDMSMIIKRTDRHYVKTPGFTSWLKKTVIQNLENGGK
jgi:hypothetical protein